MTKTILATVLLTLSTVAATACPFHDQQVMSCAEGSTFDPETNSCKVVTG